MKYTNPRYQLFPSFGSMLPHHGCRQWHAALQHLDVCLGCSPHVENLRLASGQRRTARCRCGLRLDEKEQPLTQKERQPQ
jgi:hypothetical protein